jgi:hypothetical protein
MLECNQVKVAMKKHLAIFKKGAGELILSGQKTIETRFSKSKVAPFLQVSTGDLVYIKPVGKDIIGQFRVKKVIFFDGLKEEDLIEIEKQFGEKILADSDYFKQKKVASFGTLIYVGQVTPFITSPIKFTKKDLRGWVVLD